MRIIVMAASAGGIPALIEVLGALPAGFPAPIVIVQHRTPHLPSVLVDILARRTRLSVEPAMAGHALEAGTVYVARPDRHLEITRANRFAYHDGQRIRSVLSSANPLFTSSAEAFGAGAIAVVLSGSGIDGTDGVQAVKSHGGIVIAQSKETAPYFGMPGSAIQTGAVDLVLPLAEIAPALVRLVSETPAAAG